MIKHIINGKIKFSLMGMIHTMQGSGAHWHLGHVFCNKPNVQWTGSKQGSLHSTETVKI
jgi:hypothetical protein